MRPEPSESVREIERIREILTADQIALLASYLFDGQSQRELGKAADLTQEAISYRLRQIVKRLRAEGIPVRLRGPGQRPGRARPLSQIMDRMDASTLLNAGPTCRADD